MGTILVILIVILAAAYVGRKFIKSAKGGGCGCEDCTCSCDQTNGNCLQKDIEDKRDL
ncbi:FeoB-associated Cys-rich membrane protein [Dethiosulfatarculus sandiegensis]|uniref:FeoB-associated Cys-rich membrane protein n=1 Tax=Dethiosulfatarculus sandiegensis TaxID=1429043 RepID=A0A0D2J6E5_9BACT|nr:FeoB-associated Cys-rich membrane protein [Dethiosulfatarculus sandiegensis]KIX13719.1 hypothetical protein X474_12255 [Dethiosulfatarculus sandiegensis]